MSLVRSRINRVVIASVLAMSSLSMAGVADASPKKSQEPTCCTQSEPAPGGGTEAHSAQWG